MAAVAVTWHKIDLRKKSGCVEEELQSTCSKSSASIPDAIPDATGGHFAEVAMYAVASVTSRVGNFHTGFGCS